MNKSHCKRKANELDRWEESDNLPPSRKKARSSRNPLPMDIIKPQAQRMLREKLRQDQESAEKTWDDLILRFGKFLQENGLTSRKTKYDRKLFDEGIIRFSTEPHNKAILDLLDENGFKSEVLDALGTNTRRNIKDRSERAQCRQTVHVESTNEPTSPPSPPSPPSLELSPPSSGLSSNSSTTKAIADMLIYTSNADAKLPFCSLFYLGELFDKNMESHDSIHLAFETYITSLAKINGFRSEVDLLIGLGSFKNTQGYRDKFAILDSGCWQAFLDHQLSKGSIQFDFQIIRKNSVRNKLFPDLVTTAGTRSSETRLGCHQTRSRLESIFRKARNSGLIGGHIYNDT